MEEGLLNIFVDVALLNYVLPVFGPNMDLLLNPEFPIHSEETVLFPARIHDVGVNDSMLKPSAALAKA